MVLDGTSANAGKTSVRYYGSGSGIGTLNSLFTSEFRWYMDPYNTSRTVALNLSVAGHERAGQRVEPVRRGCHDRSGR